MITMYRSTIGLQPVTTPTLVRAFFSYVRHAPGVVARWEVARFKQGPLELYRIDEETGIPMFVRHAQYPARAGSVDAVAYEAWESQRDAVRRLHMAELSERTRRGQS